MSDLGNSIKPKPSSHEPSRMERFFNRTNAAAHEPSTAKSDSQKRRQQVYQAQKRHRERKTEYVKDLEAEVASLRNRDAAVNSERNALEHENAAIRRLLQSRSVGALLDSVDLDATGPSAHGLSPLADCTIELRYDSDIGHTRTFVDRPSDPNEEIGWSSPNPASSSQGEQTRPSPARQLVCGDSVAALDFILALEWRCQSHIWHEGLHPRKWWSVGSMMHEASLQGFGGHSMCATSAVYHAARPAERPSSEGGKQCAHQSQPWAIPHEEIDKLIALSETLELDELAMTPAQLYAAVLQSVPTQELLVPSLAALKISLAPFVRCLGFGAIMDSYTFWTQLQNTLDSFQPNPQSTES